MRRAAAFVVAAALGAALFAHDFWIEPSTFRPQVGETGTARPCGPHLRASRLLASKLDRDVRAFFSAGTTPLDGRDGDDPASSIRITAPGLQFIGYRSHDYPVSIDAAKFEDYLKEEGLEEIAKVRATRGETQKPAREVFSRAAKALLDAGTSAGKSAKGFDRDLGFTLELLVDKNPYGSAPGSTLPFASSTRASRRREPWCRRCRSRVRRRGWPPGPTRRGAWRSTRRHRCGHQGRA
jgi:hypothetical protein